MKRFFSMPLVVLMSLLFGCVQDGRDTLILPPLKHNSGTLKNADMEFVNSEIPTGRTVYITDVLFNGYAIAGGSFLITVTSSERLSELYLQVGGESGYYVRQLSNADLISSEGGNYVYSVPLFFSQELDGKNLLFTVSGMTAQNGISSGTDNTVQIIKAGTGALQVSLSWDKDDDLDLHIITPSGKEVYFANKAVAATTKAGKAELDVDSNPGCHIDGKKVENIYFASPLEAGDYTVGVCLFMKCSSSGPAGARYNVSANTNGQFLTFSPAQNGQFDADDYDGHCVTIGTITIGGGNTYTVTFNANGGTVSPTSGITGASGKLASLPTPTRSGYTFDGWYTATTGGTKVEVSKVYSANTTIYARWTAEPVTPTYTITFNHNYSGSANTTDSTGKDGKLASLPEPTREGYTFDGWYTATTGGTKVEVSKVYSASTTIYARWTAEPVTPTYTITFNHNYSGSTNTTDSTGKDGKLASLPEPTRTGYTFDGWYTATTGGTKVEVSKVYSANTTIYAQWTAEPVTPPTGSTFTDSRDSKSYKKVTIGTQTWMGENLNYNASGSVCYGDDPANCNTYGRLYNWSTALNGSSSSSLNPSGVRGVCPTGWHLPSDVEWTTLTDFVGSNAGTKLKSPDYWSTYSGVPKGTNDYGFSALPGGYGYSGGNFYDAGDYGSWWSATEDTASRAWGRDMYYGSEYVGRFINDKAYLFSVRCLQD